MQNIKILAIETSCDDTGVAVLEVPKRPGAPSGSYPNFNVLSNIVSSQIEIHKKYGGVYPMMAKRAHQRNMLPTFMHALKHAGILVANLKAEDFDSKKIEKILDREPELYKKLIPFLKKYKKPDVNLISVTNGPGLEPCLWVGINFAKALSSFWNIPIVTVNHVESHILINLLEYPNIKFPAVALVVSGGHTQIVLVNDIGKYKILGETRDDAAGECFDKCAKILGLGYPGGPIISKLAEGIKTKRLLPRPMIGTKDYDFSFSGLKTAVLYADRKVKNKTSNYKKEMAAEVQQAVIDVLIRKTMKAVMDFDVKSLVLGGGVSANRELKKQLKNKLEKEYPSTEFYAPKPNLSTDNALMCAITGFYHKNKKEDWKKIKADGNLRIA